MCLCAAVGWIKVKIEHEHGHDTEDAGSEDDALPKPPMQVPHLPALYRLAWPHTQDRQYIPGC